jgi:Arc/MetJ-type ribon-helix-helix transcriptional regulator
VSSNPKGSPPHRPNAEANRITVVLPPEHVELADAIAASLPGGGGSRSMAIRAALVEYAESHRIRVKKKSDRGP